MKENLKKYGMAIGLGIVGLIVLLFATLGGKKKQNRRRRLRQRFRGYANRMPFRSKRFRMR